jgi:glucose/mannose-6-phosphate isomerase
MHLVLLRDSEEHPRVARRADVVTDLARSRGLDVSSLLAEGSSSFQRIASLVHLADWATAYLAVAEGIDPTPVQPIDELKDALRR